MRRLRLVGILDWIVLALLLAAFVIDLTGGFHRDFGGGIRISARQADRGVLAALAVLVVRLWVGRGIAPLGGRLTRLVPLRDWLFARAADPAPPLPSASESLKHFAYALVGFLAMGGMLLRTQLAHMDSVPDLGDPLFSMWRMGWLLQQVRGDPRPLFEGNIFYPEPLTLTYSDSMLLPSLTSAPLLAIGLHPVIAYNVLFLSGFLFSALATYALIVRVTGSARAAFVGGLLYGFYPYRFEHYSHLELQMTHWMPLALIALHRFSERLQWRYAILAALCGVAQLYSSMYYGVFFPLYAAPILLTLLLAARAPWRRVGLVLGTAAVIAAVLAVPLARPYLAAQDVKGERDVPTVTFYSANASDYFRAHPRSAIYGGKLLADEHPERALFPGLTPLVFSAAALVPPLGVTRLAYTAGLLFSFELSRGFNGRLYGFLYDWFLPIRGMRVPARISVILAISLAVLGGCGALRLMTRFKTKPARTIAFVAVVGAVAIDLHPALELQRVWREPPSIYGGVSAYDGSVLAEYPFSTKVPGVTSNLQYMYFSLWHWVPMVNGYSGFSSDAYRQFVDELGDFPGPVALAAMKARGVTHVTVHCAFLTDGCGPLVELLNSRPDVRLVASSQWEGHPVNLYELVR